MYSLLVTRDGSRYPLFHEGQEKESFHLRPGERFSSGETVFELLTQTARTLTVQAMQRFNRDNAEQVLQVLLGLQSLLNEWHEPATLANRAMGLLNELLPGSEVAFYTLDEHGDSAPLTATTLRPSRSLIADCLSQELPAYHVWNPSTKDAQPTQYANEHWALVAPILTSSERIVLYAMGRDSDNTPGELQRSALSLVAQTLGQHLEGRRAMLLAARVQAEQQANRNLRVLLQTLERSLSLKDGQIESAFVEGARELTGASQARFLKDLSEWIGDENCRRGREESESYIAVAFEHYRPKGLLCKKTPDEPFRAEDEEWLEALLGFAETVFENRRLHHQVRSSLAQLKNSQAQLVQSSQWAAAGRLAANAAHELNTPLGAIKLAAETAQTFLSEPGPSVDSLKLIERSVERCKRVTERLLVYSQPREDKEVKTFSLGDVVEDSIGSLSPFIKSKQCNIERPSEIDCLVTGDIQDCYWAITNVLKNALEAMTESETRTIRLFTSLESDTVLLTIEDTGHGVPPELKESLFEPFTSTKKIGEGNGLGLAISRRNLRSWGGEISSAKSSLDGAAFVLKLPIASKEKSQARTA